MSASSAAPRRRSATTSALLLALTGAALVAYPVLAWFTLRHWGAAAVGGLLLLLFVPRLLLRLAQLGPKAFRDHETWLATVMVVLALGALLLGRLEAALLAPAVLNVGLASAFALTLAGSAPPMIERFARRIHQDLRPAEIAWCRNWTWIWLAFFLGNAGLVSALAAWAPVSWWVAYTGLVAYLLVAGLITTEILLRKQRFGFRRAEPIDNWLLDRFPSLPERADDGTAASSPPDGVNTEVRA